MTTTTPTPSPTSRPARVKVLVLLHPDNFVQVLGEPHVDARIVNMLDVDPEQEHLAELYAEHCLPQVYRELFYPNKVRATGQVRKVSAEAELQRRADLDVLHGLRELANAVLLVDEEAT